MQVCNLWAPQGIANNNADLDCARASHTCALVGQKLVIHGGSNSKDKVSPTTFIVSKVSNDVSAPITGDGGSGTEDGGLPNVKHTRHRSRSVVVNSSLSEPEDTETSSMQRQVSNHRDMKSRGWMATLPLVVPNGSSPAPSVKGHTCLLYNDHFVLFGGCDDKKVDTADLWVCHAGKSEISVGWRMIRPSNEGGSASAVRPSPRSYHAAFIKGNKMFVHGGRHMGKALGDMWSLDLDTYQWEEVEYGGCLEPTQRFGHVCCTGPEIGYALLFGGRLGKGIFKNKPESDFWLIDLSTFIWTPVKLKGTYPIGRVGHRGCFIEKGLFLFFGGYAYPNYLKDLFVFDMERRQCFFISDTREKNRPSSRRNHSLVYDSTSKFIHVFGGKSRKRGTFSDLWSCNVRGVLDVVLASKTYKQSSSFVKKGSDKADEECLSPRSPWPELDRRIAIGNNHLLSRNYLEALQEGTECLKLDCTSLEGLELCAKAYFGLGNFHRAHSAASQCWTLSAKIIDGQSLIYLGRYKSAITTLRNALAKHGDNFDLQKALRKAVRYDKVLEAKMKNKERTRNSKTPEKEAQEDSGVIADLALIGPPKTGKTTFLLGLKSRVDQHFIHEQCKQCTHRVQHLTLKYLKYFLLIQDKLQMVPDNQDMSITHQLMVADKYTSDIGQLMILIFHDIMKTLPQIKDRIHEISDFIMHENALYFVQNIDRICDEGYVCSECDLMYMDRTEMNPIVKFSCIIENIRYTFNETTADDIKSICNCKAFVLSLSLADYNYTDPHRKNYPDHIELPFTKSGSQSSPKVLSSVSYNESPVLHQSPKLSKTDLVMSSSLSGNSNNNSNNNNNSNSNSNSSNNSNGYSYSKIEDNANNSGGNVIAINPLSTSTIVESLNLFHVLCNSAPCKDIPVIILMNKVDAFMEKIAHQDLNILFPDYQGGPSFDPAVLYIRNCFSRLNINKSRKIYFVPNQLSNSQSANQINSKKLLLSIHHIMREAILDADLIEENLW